MSLGTLLRKFSLLLLIPFLAGGCSLISWSARFFMFQAEEAYNKAYELRHTRVAYEERIKYYRIACRAFSRAYDIDEHLFTLNRINFAIESCMRVGDTESEKKLQDFEERYAREHPKEVEYGEAGFMIGLE